MKKLLILVILNIFSLSLMGCGSNSDSNKCGSPSNPYGDGGGHDAGFSRAEEKGGVCEGNSSSFNEGCEEYYSQLDEYENCKR
ncbi:MAG: hypothetical protein PHR61_01990 [Candidatus Absconditabacteria bacterium]|nr:hypothetical protein [Candidatus Absconditabacteria bacterium]